MGDKPFDAKMDPADVTKGALDKDSSAKPADVNKRDLGEEPFASNINYAAIAVVEGG